MEERREARARDHRNYVVQRHKKLKDGARSRMDAMRGDAGRIAACASDARDSLAGLIVVRAGLMVVRGLLATATMPPTPAAVLDEPDCWTRTEQRQVVSLASGGAAKSGSAAGSDCGAGLHGHSPSQQQQHAWSPSASATSQACAISLDASCGRDHWADQGMASSCSSIRMASEMRTIGSRVWVPSQVIRRGEKIVRRCKARRAGIASRGRGLKPLRLTGWKPVPLPVGHHGA